MVNRIGRHFATFIKRDGPGAADKWHLDEVVIPINGQNFWLQRWLMRVPEHVWPVWI